MATAVASASGFKQEPAAPLGFIDPDLDQTCGGNVAVLVTHVVRLPQSRG